MKRLEARPEISYGPVFRLDGSRRDLRWIEHASRGLRVLEPSRDIERRFDWTRGYYCDPWQDSETRPRVIALPARGGVPQYLPACTDPYKYNPDSFVADMDRETDLDDAWRSAYGLAELYADTERDYQIKAEAEQRVEDLRGEIVELRAKHSAAVRELRSARRVECAAPTLCAMLRDGLAGMRSRVHAARKQIADLTANPYSMLEGY